MVGGLNKIDWRAADNDSRVTTIDIKKKKSKVGREK